jgi:hypothetical protein
MSECIDPRIGQLLYAYELGALPEEDVEKFELHLFECEYCLNELNASENMSRLLRMDQQIMKITETELQKQGRAEPFLARLWKLLWPRGNLILKPALAYLLILLLLTPAYHGIVKRDTQKVRVASQSIELIPPIRGEAEMKVIDKKLGEQANIAFYFDGARVGAQYKVIIESPDGRIIYKNDSFHAFDKNHIGRLNLFTSLFEPGIYKIKLSAFNQDSLLEPQEYLFEISD